MGTKISELTEYTEVIDDDVLPIVDVTNNATKKVKVGDLQKKIVEQITIESGSTITNGYSVTLSNNYVVGNNSLKLYWNGVLLQKATTSDGHYTEIGTDGNKSNEIQFYRTSSDGEYMLSEDAILTAIISG